MKINLKINSLAFLCQGIKVMAVCFVLFASSVLDSMAGTPSNVQAFNPATVKVKDIENLFLEKEGSNVRLSFSDAENNVFELSGIVKGHLNPGPETGVLNILFLNSSTNVKLLVSRKLRYGSLIYKITLINNNTKTWYSAQSPAKDFFSISKVSQNQIVTE